MAQGFLVLFGWGEETTRFHEKIVVHISDDVFLILGCGFQPLRTRVPLI